MSTEYEIKTKMEQEQWLQLKVLFLLGYNQLLFSGGIVFRWGGGGGRVYWWDFFWVEGEWANFQLVG